MGGYAIQSHCLDEQYLITGQGRVTLTKEGILFLLKNAPEVLPMLTEDEILDKSKASTLVKSLTCLQAFWFCLQCIVRLTMNSAISLLELNVFGHCICTFIIYAIWWTKPLDICEPTVLRAEGRPELQGLIALLCSYTSRTVPRLPPPLDECVIGGRAYRKQSRCLECHMADGSDKYYQALTGSLIHRCSPEQGVDYGTQYRGYLDTSFGLRGGSSAPLVSYIPPSETRMYDVVGPNAHDTETKIFEYAGLRVERLERLLNLDESDSLM